MAGEGAGPTFDRGEHALHGAEDDRPALVLPEPRREAADVGERGGGDHPPLERAQDEELHPQDGRGVELVRVQPELRQPRRVVLLHFARQRQARHREKLQCPLLPSLNPSPKTATMHRQSIHHKQSANHLRRNKMPAMASDGNGKCRAIKKAYIDSPLRQEAIEVSHRDVRRLPTEPEHGRCL